jgi:predicted dehydrogenase
LEVTALGRTKRKGAIVGYGFIAEKGHLPAYKRRDEFEIVAVADVCAARRRAAAAALPGARIYEDHATLIAKERAELDFLDITTPPYAHAPIAHAALDAGMHVLCEKPLATSVAEGRALVEHAARAKRVLFPAHNYRHAPVIQAVRQVLDAGLIGKVHLVTLHTFRNTHARGVPEWNTHWRREKKFSGGGIAMDHGSHTFYLALDWMRSEPSSFTAKMSTTNGYDTEDNFSGTITFPTGTATVHLTWTAGVRKVIYTVHGEHGAIRVEDDDVEVATMEPGTGPGRSVTWQLKKERVASEWMDASHAGWFRSLFGQFGDAMDKGEHVGKDAKIALKCLELIDAAYASAADGSRERSLGER